MNTNEISMLMEVWQPEISSQPQQTNLEELKSWISDGKLLPTSKVRIKNLNWIEAQQVPVFQKLFESKNSNISVNSAPVQTPPLPLNISPVKTKPENTESSDPPQNSASTAGVNTFRIYSDTSESSIPFQIYEKKTLAKTGQIEEKEEKTESYQPPPKQKKNTQLLLKNVLVFSAGCFLMFLLAWGGSYLWVFQLRSPIKIDEKSVTELVVLEDRLATDKIGLRLKIAAIEQESAAATNNQENSAQKTDFSQESAKLEKQYDAQRKIILENHRNNLVTNDFNNTFYASFAVLMILFLLMRIFSNKTPQPTENTYSPKSHTLQTDDYQNMQTEVNQDIQTEVIQDNNIENSQNIHITKSSEAHITKQPDTNTTESPNKLETIDEFVQNPEYLSYVEVNKADFCLLHREESAEFVCEICSNYFCVECPKAVGSVENCCPFCKVVCKSVDSIKNDEPVQQTAPKENNRKKLPAKERKTIPNFTVHNYQNEKKQKLGLISAFLIALCFSSSIAYFWVYEISPRLEKKEISQNIDNNEQQKSDKNNTVKTSESAANKSVETADANVNKGVNLSGEPCIDPQTNQSFVCDEETKKALYEHTRKTKSVADAQKQVSEKTNTILSLIVPSSSPAAANADQEKQNPIELERKENDKRRFVQVFIISFILIFGFLVSIKLFSK